MILAFVYNLVFFIIKARNFNMTSFEDDVLLCTVSALTIYKSTVILYIMMMKLMIVPFKIVTVEVKGRAWKEQEFTIDRFASWSRWKWKKHSCQHCEGSCTVVLRWHWLCIQQSDNHNCCKHGGLPTVDKSCQQEMTARPAYGMQILEQRWPSSRAMMPESVARHSARMAFVSSAIADSQIGARTSAKAIMYFIEDELLTGD